ncbi:nitrilase-related carbon-nitrogen hydrolase [Wenzhouxiangella marina]|uniref:Omega-amidase YafV n=1 Tax=Wenzhouxiangella marina TaxID=1579979 RepID=A0A0K0XWZ0_9GAMM|nr:nitrilase-related carbon-nitrogen hydrolase [Wenzhouxiangella marina]AKS42141.1 Putative amidohydrolase [Wenzhouxiangella marina]MBB6086087.1 putative amidohydrolase [Wenzhouxiangella marina]
MPETSNSLNTVLVQADLRWQDPVGNREHLSALMDEADVADLFVLPETFATGFLGDLDGAAESMAGDTLAWMKAEAIARKAAICGSLALLEDGRRFNRFLFVDEQGALLGHYDKHHLFGFGGEDQRYTAGVAPTVIDWRGWRIDLQICYDLRFPVWCRNDRDFDLQLFVANWPSPRVEAWRALLRARAIENQAYVIGVNRVGRDGNETPYPGCSSAWDAMGACLVELDAQARSERVELHLDRLRTIRREFPFQADRDAFELRP